MGGSSRKLYLGSSFLVLVGYMITKGFLQPRSSSKCVLLYIDEDCDPVNKFYYCDMSALPNGLEGLREKNELLPVIKLIDTFDAQYHVIANDNAVFTFLTNKDAPKYKLVRVDLKELLFGLTLSKKLKKMYLNQHFL